MFVLYAVPQRRPRAANGHGTARTARQALGYSSMRSRDILMVCIEVTVLLPALDPHVLKTCVKISSNDQEIVMFTPHMGLMNLMLRHNYTITSVHGSARSRSLSAAGCDSAVCDQREITTSSEVTKLRSYLAGKCAGKSRQSQ
eukprot:6183182-Pleurochrysis_carterae.AAC.1